MAKPTQPKRGYDIFLRFGSQNGRIPILQTPAVCFILSWISYFMVYFIRRAQTTTKVSYQKTFGISDLWIGWLDNCYLVPYALGQTLYPNAVERLGARKAWTIVLIPSSICLMLVYLNSNVWAFASILMVVALCHALVWPAAVKQMENFMTTAQYELLIPLWMTCCHLGNVAGNLVAAHILSQKDVDFGCVSITLNSTMEQVHNITIEEIANKSQFGGIDACLSSPWKLTFLILATVTLCWGIVNAIIMPDDSPKQMRNMSTINMIDAPFEHSSSSDDECRTPVGDIQISLRSLTSHDNVVVLSKPESKQLHDTKAHAAPLSMFEILKTTPVAWLLAISSFCTKGTKYWYYYWSIPFMVHTTQANKTPITETQAILINTYFDIGAFVGSIAIMPLLKVKCGTWKLRAATIGCLVCILGLASLGVLTYLIQRDKIAFFAVEATTFIFGFAMGMPDSLYAGICASELATYDGRSIRASVSGFANGFGGFGPFIGSPLSGLIGGTFGHIWTSATAFGMLFIGVVSSLFSEIWLGRLRKTYYSRTVSSVDSS